MAFQGKILFIVALAFFVQKVRCNVEHSLGAHMFLTRGIDSEDEAADQTDSYNEDDPEVTVTPTNTVAPIRQPRKETKTKYEDLHSSSMMEMLTNEYVRLIETEIASQTVEQVMEKIKRILKDEKSVQNFKRIRGEVYQYMTDPEMPKMITTSLENRYQYYIDEKTPDLIRKKFSMIRSILNNSNIQKHIQFLRKSAVNFLTQPGDVRPRIANVFSLVSALLRLPSISWN